MTTASGLRTYFVKLAIDEGIAKNDVMALRNIALIYFGVSVVQVLTNIARVRLMSRVGQHVLYDVRMQMFHHLQKLSLSFYNRYSVGRVIKRLFGSRISLRAERLTYAIGFVFLLAFILWISGFDIARLGTTQ